MSAPGSGDINQYFLNVVYEQKTNVSWHSIQAILRRLHRYTWPRWEG
jgi:hypothetical protein